MGFIQSLGAFLLALGILITFHEFGHFWVARKCNVKVLRFSVGFGRPIWKRYFGEDRCEFIVAALPLGGYVKMLDEREGEVAPQERHRAFNNKSLGQRFAIVIAGPIFNFIFAVFAYWIMFMIGITGLKPVVGEIDSASMVERAGFRSGDEIIRVDDRETPIWSAVMNIIVARVVDGAQVKFTLRGQDGIEREAIVDVSQVSVDDMAGGNLLRILGLYPKRPVVPAVIGELVQGKPAEQAGLLVGDKIIAVNAVPVKDWMQWVDIIRANPQRPINVEVARDQQQLSIMIVPQSVLTEEGEAIGRIGAAVDDGYTKDKSLMAIQSYSIIPAFSRAVAKTAEMSVLTLRILAKIITGEASVKNLSGPISIARYAGQTAGLGVVAFLGFLAIVSVSLGVLNLLPIPLLDGGHLMYYLIELLKGSPVSEATQVIGQQIGLAMLLGLMGIAFYNDILRLMA
ncbi:MAG: RIP metalloprotease RseP [Proteobacteria bacterium]|nr:RIP metalloprotease RseP [Pseudomonadota bacterium]